MREHASRAFVARLCALILLLGSGLEFAAPAGAQTACKTVSRLSPCGTIAPPPGNVAPVISGLPSAAVRSGDAYLFQPVASDADGDPLFFKIVNRPGWASFSSSTGRLSGKPPHAAVGEYVDIRISVHDGYREVSLPQFSVTVTQGNRKPRISGTPPTAGVEGQAYVFTPGAKDRDGDTLTFSIANRPAWASFSSATGALSGIPGYGTVGSYEDIVISVSDGTASAVLPPFTIGVQQAALGSATLSWQAPTTRTDGSLLTNLAGYRIRYGTSVGSYPNLIDIPNGGLTSAVVSNLPPATWYFVVSAYDTTGAESNNSSPVSKTIS